MAEMNELTAARGPVEPTSAENLLLWRRRRGLNQVEAAAEMDVPVDRYRAWEAGDHPSKPPHRYLGKLRVYELCFLLRRRKGLLQRELAKALGCTRLWVIRMEEGTAPAARLIEYWKAVK
jgi:hypothetical protein